MNGTSPNAPRVEALLDAAHRNLSRLRQRRGALIRSGISSDHLPDEVALMAFALLGDHGRADLIGQLEPDWAGLQSKGLAQGTIREMSSPELRLLAHALPLTAAIDDLWFRLRNAVQAPAAPSWMFRCASSVRGLWGQMVRLHFSAQDVVCILVTPDPVFGLQPAMVAPEPDGRCVGSIVFPVDNGVVTISLLQRSGEIFRHAVHASVEGLA